MFLLLFTGGKVTRSTTGSSLCIYTHDTYCVISFDVYLSFDKDVFWTRLQPLLCAKVLAGRLRESLRTQSTELKISEPWPCVNLACVCFEHRYNAQVTQVTRLHSSLT